MMGHVFLRRPSSWLIIDHRRAAAIQFEPHVRIKANTFDNDGATIVMKITILKAQENDAKDAGGDVSGEK